MLKIMCSTEKARAKLDKSGADVDPYACELAWTKHKVFLFASLILSLSRCAPVVLLLLPLFLACVCSFATECNRNPIICDVIGKICVLLTLLTKRLCEPNAKIYIKKQQQQQQQKSLSVFMPYKQTHSRSFSAAFFLVVFCFSSLLSHCFVCILALCYAVCTGDGKTIFFKLMYFKIDFHYSCSVLEKLLHTPYCIERDTCNIRNAYHTSK